MCKDGDGRVGIKVKAVNKGIFVCLVTKDSPAAVGGLRLNNKYKCIVYYVLYTLYLMYCVLQYSTYLLHPGFPLPIVSCKIIFILIFFLGSIFSFLILAFGYFVLI